MTGKNHFMRQTLALSVCVALLAVPSGIAAQDKFAFFESKIRPILVRHCYECHSADSDEAEGKLLLDARDSARKGGESGAAIVPGKPEKSLLFAALQYEALEMPPAGKLPDHVIADFERWIRAGAPDPRDRSPQSPKTARRSWQAQLAQQAGWWSLQPAQDHSPPEVSRLEQERKLRARDDKDIVLRTVDEIDTQYMTVAPARNTSCTVLQLWYRFPESYKAS